MFLKLGRGVNLRHLFDRNSRRYHCSIALQQSKNVNQHRMKPALEHVARNLLGIE